MSGERIRTMAGALTLLGILVLAGCASTVSGTATRAADAADFDGADVSVMDTGPYSLAPGRPQGATGDDAHSQGIIESNRMAPFVVGPWQVDESLVVRDGILSTGMTGPVPTTAMMVSNGVTNQPVADVAAKHRYVAGFSTMRVSAPHEGRPPLGLHNMVMRFPDATAATAAATEMAAVSPPPQGAPPGVPIPLPGMPGAIAKTYELRPSEDVTTEIVVSFTAHGPFVLLQVAQASKEKLDFFHMSPRLLAESSVVDQRRLLDEFVPTEMSKLSELPMDATGYLLAKTLKGPDGDAPFMIGAWDPRGWLHFEDNPIISARLFDEAGVRVVTQWLTTVYEANTTEGATRLVDGFAEQIGKLSAIREIDGVPGLPSSRCFERADGLPEDTATSWQRVLWRYKCVARADNYAYTAFSANIADVKQQTAAQYRILTGR